MVVANADKKHFYTHQMTNIQRAKPHSQSMYQHLVISLSSGMAVEELSSPKGSQEIPALGSVRNASSTSLCFSYYHFSIVCYLIESKNAHRPNQTNEIETCWTKWRV